MDDVSMSESDGIETMFVEFDKGHPDVYAQFVQIARDLKARGREHYSSDAICHVIRFQRITSGPDGMGFKMNNNYTALLARKAMAEHEDLVGFFHLRERRAA